MNRCDRAEDVLLGLACGDALGRPVEFNTSEQIALFDSHAVGKYCKHLQFLLVISALINHWPSTNSQ
jgi:ADP-ribosylglycohydrolase